MLSAAGTIGKTVVYDGKEAYFQDSNIVWLENNEKLAYNAYLYYCYHAIKWKTADGGTVSRLYNELLKNTPVLIPPLPEQQSIASALSDVDELISSLEKLIEKKKNIKHGAMQELLTGKRRLPGFEGEWTEYRFWDCFEILSNNTFPRACMSDNGGPVHNIHYGDVLIKFSSILDADTDFIPYLDGSMPYCCAGLRDGDLIIADTAEDETVGKATELQNVGNMEIVSGLHTIPCRPTKDIFTPMWLGYYINHSVFHDQILPFITGIKVSSLSKSSLGKTKLSVPCKEEQSAIVSVLYDMDKELKSLTEKLEKYRKVKQGMMQKLLTGEIRLG